MRQCERLLCWFMSVRPTRRLLHAVAMTAAHSFTDFTETWKQSAKRHCRVVVVAAAAAAAAAAVVVATAAAAAVVVSCVCCFFNVAETKQSPERRDHNKQYQSTPRTESYS